MLLTFLQHLGVSLGDLASVVVVGLVTLGVIRWSAITTMWQTIQALESSIKQRDEEIKQRDKETEELKKEATRNKTKLDFRVLILELSVEMRELTLRQSDKEKALLQDTLEQALDNLIQSDPVVADKVTARMHMLRTIQKEHKEEVFRWSERARAELVQVSPEHADRLLHQVNSPEITRRIG